MYYAAKKNQTPKARLEQKLKLKDVTHTHVGSREQAKASTQKKNFQHFNEHLPAKRLNTIGIKGNAGSPVFALGNADKRGPINSDGPPFQRVFLNKERETRINMQLMYWLKAVQLHKLHLYVTTHFRLQCMRYVFCQRARVRSETMSIILPTFHAFQIVVIRRSENK